MSELLRFLAALFASLATAMAPSPPSLQRCRCTQPDAVCSVQQVDGVFRDEPCCTWVWCGDTVIVNDPVRP